MYTPPKVLSLPLLAGSSHSTMGLFLPAGIKITFNWGSELMRIQPNGNVGIGTTSPVNLLHLYGTDGNSYLRWTSDVATTGTRIGYNGTEFRIDQQQNDDVTIRTNCIERMRITSGGACFAGAVCATSFPTLSDYRMKYNQQTMIFCKARR